MHLEAAHYHRIVQKAEIDVLVVVDPGDRGFALRAKRGVFLDCILQLLAHTGKGIHAGIVPLENATLLWCKTLATCGTNRGGDGRRCEEPRLGKDEGGDDIWVINIDAVLDDMIDSTVDLVTGVRMCFQNTEMNSWHRYLMVSPFRSRCSIILIGCPSSRFNGSREPGSSKGHTTASGRPIPYEDGSTLLR